MKQKLFRRHETRIYNKKCVKKKTWPEDKTCREDKAVTLPIWVSISQSPQVCLREKMRMGHFGNGLEGVVHPGSITVDGANDIQSNGREKKQRLSTSLQE